MIIFFEKKSLVPFFVCVNFCAIVTKTNPVHNAQRIFLDFLNFFVNVDIFWERKKKKLSYLDNESPRGHQNKVRFWNISTVLVDLWVARFGSFLLWTIAGPRQNWKTNTLSSIWFFFFSQFFANWWPKKKIKIGIFCQRFLAFLYKIPYEFEGKDFLENILPCFKSFFPQAISSVSVFF